MCCRQSTEGWRTECGHMWFYSASYLYNLKYSNNLPGSRGSQLRSPCRRCSLAFPLRLHGRSWVSSALLPRSLGKMLISKQSSGAPAGFRDHILASLRLIWMRACPSSQNDPIQSGSHLPVPDFTSRAFQRLHLLCIPQEASLLLPKAAFCPPHHTMPRSSWRRGITRRCPPTAHISHQGSLGVQDLPSQPRDQLCNIAD